LEGDLVVHPDCIQIGDHYIRYITMVKQPDQLEAKYNSNGLRQSYTCKLLELPYPVRLDTIFQTVNQEKELGKLDRDKTLNLSVTDNSNMVKTETNEIRFNQVRQDTIEIRTNQYQIYKCGVVAGVIAQNKDVLKRRVNEVTNVFKAIGFTTLQETYDNLTTHYALLPGMAYNFYQTVKTVNPCISVYFQKDKPRSYSNEEGILFMDRNSKPIRKNIGEYTDNPHCIIIGPSGTGKTVFVKHLILERFYKGERQFITDEKGDFKDIVNNLGGRHIDYRADNPEKLNPFLIDADSKDNKRLEFLAQFIVSLYKGKEEMINQTTSMKFEYSVVIDMLDKFLSTVKDKPTITLFYNWYKDNEIESGIPDKFPKIEFETALKMYAVGLFRHLFNHTENIEDFSDETLLSFDFASIKDATYYPQVFFCVSQIMRSQVKKYPLQTKWLYMDECWSPS